MAWRIHAGSMCRCGHERKRDMQIDALSTAPSTMFSMLCFRKIKIRQPSLPINFDLRCAKPCLARQLCSELKKGTQRQGQKAPAMSGCDLEHDQISLDFTASAHDARTTSDCH
jgi:hypothetical protein